jgi:hypothetical protein
MPLVPTDDFEKRESRFLVVFGRLAEGATTEEARAEMDGIGRNLASAYLLTNRDFVPVAQNYNVFYIGPQVAIIFESMLVAVGFVLLIACANTHVDAGC